MFFHPFTQFLLAIFFSPFKETKQIDAFNQKLSFFLMIVLLLNLHRDETAVDSEGWWKAGREGSKLEASNCPIVLFSIQGIAGRNCRFRRRVEQSCVPQLAI